MSTSSTRRRPISSIWCSCRRCSSSKILSVPGMIAQNSCSGASRARRPSANCSASILRASAKATYNLPERVHSIDAKPGAKRLPQMTPFTTRPEILGRFGVVASTHWIGSAVGMSMLEKGGNAFDAAVAAGFVLQVVEPHLVGPGGDLPAIVYSKAKDEVEVICAQGTAPARATIEHYRGAGLTKIPGNGLLATVIPGSFDGWMLMLRDYGRL